MEGRRGGVKVDPLAFFNSSRGVRNLSRGGSTPPPPSNTALPAAALATLKRAATNFAAW